MEDINKVSNQDAATLPIDKDSLLYLSELTGTDYATKRITVLALMGEVGLTGTTNNTIRYGADGQAVESDALQNDGTDVTVKNVLFIEGDRFANLYTEGAGATEKFIINYDSPNIPYIVFDKATLDFLIKDGDGLSNLLTIRAKGQYSELRGEKGKIHISDDFGGVLLVSDPTLTAEANGGFLSITDDYVFLGRNFATIGEFGFEFGNFNNLGNNRVYLEHTLDDGISNENVLESQRNNISGVQLNTYGSKNADIHTFKGVAKAEVQPDTLVDFDTLSYTTKEYVDTRSSKEYITINSYVVSAAGSGAKTPQFSTNNVSNNRFFTPPNYKVTKIWAQFTSNVSADFDFEVYLRNGTNNADAFEKLNVTPLGVAGRVDIYEFAIPDTANNQDNCVYQLQFTSKSGADNQILLHGFTVELTKIV
jgi:hypothetical protein